MTSTTNTRTAGDRQFEYWQQARIDSGQDPDEESIKALCAEIREGWSKDVERGRRATGFYVPAALAEVTVPNFPGRSSDNY